MANDPVYITFEFRGDLDKEVEKVTLGIKGLRDESAKTYQRLIADSSTAYNALSADNRRMALSVQENINALRDLATTQKVLDQELEDGNITTRQYMRAKAALAIQEGNLREAISSGMRELNTSIETERAAIGSITSLQKKLQELTNTYYNLSKADREGAAGQGILKQIGGLDKEISAAQTTLASYSRTASGGFDNLSMSVQQVARELPSLTMGANMFFLAISNNLPILADNIRAARREYEAMRQAGQKGVPVWKQLLGSILSWQTALVVGITVLSMYGKEIIAWSKSLVTGKKSLVDTLETLDEFQASVSKSSGSTITQLQRMSAEWTALGDDLEAKKHYLTENGSAFDGLGVSIRSVADAEKLFNEGKEEFISGLMARAQAAAAMEMAAKEYEKAIQKMQEADEASKNGVTLGDRFKSMMARAAAHEDPSGTLAGADLSPEAFAKERIDRINEEKERLFKSGNDLLQKYADYSEKEQASLRKIGLDATETIVEGSVAAIEASIARKREALRRLTNKADYDKALREIETEEKRLEAITGEQGRKEKGKRQTKEQYAKEAANTVKAETAMRELEIERQKQVLAQKEKDAELELRQQRVSLMRDGAEKELEQIRLDYDKRINEIEKKGREYILAQQKIERAAWENENPNWKKQGLIFRPSTTMVSQLPDSQREELENAGVIAGATREKAEADLHEKTLRQYQDYSARRLELEKKYNDDVAYLSSQRTAANGAEIDAAIKEARRSLKKGLSDLSMEELKDSGLWDKLFGDLDKMAMPSLEALLKQAKEVNTTAWDPRNVKEYQDAINRLEDAIHSRSPFKAIGDDWKKLLESMKKGDKDGMASALDGIDSATQSLISDLDTIAGGIGDIFGEEAGYAAGQVVELTSSLGGFVSAASKIATGDIVGGIASALGSIGKLFSMGKRVKEMNRQAREEQQKYYDEAIQGEMEYQRLLRERLRTQQQIGEMTLAYNKRITEELERQQKASSGEYDRLLAQIQGEQYISGVGYRHGTWFRKAKTWNEYSSLAGKSYEDIEKLYTEGKLEEKVAKLFEQLRSLKEEGADIDRMLDDQEESMREVLTGTTTDSIANSILQGLAEGKRSAKDFADDFQEMLNNAVLQGIKMKALEELLRQWYESFAAASDNGLTAENIASLKAQYDKIIEDAAKQLEDMEKITGSKIDTAFSQQAKAGAYTVASQDSINETNGRLTSIQVNIAEVKECAFDMRTILNKGLEHLEAIDRNTSYCKRLERIDNTLLEILRNGLRTK